jgi:hypothetical protein
MNLHLMSGSLISEKNRKNLNNCLTFTFYATKWRFSELNSKFTSKVTCIYGSTALVDLGRFYSFLIYTQSVGLLGRGSARRKNNTNRINAHRHPCLEWDLNPWSKCSCERRQSMPLWSASEVTYKTKFGTRYTQHWMKWGKHFRELLMTSTPTKHWATFHLSDICNWRRKFLAKRPQVYIS